MNNYTYITKYEDFNFIINGVLENIYKIEYFKEKEKQLKFVDGLLKHLNKKPHNKLML